MLVFVRDARGVAKELKLEPLGRTCIASTVSYLDEGVVYLGSCAGDSQVCRHHAYVLYLTDSICFQLVKLNTEADESGSFITTLTSFTSIGPIVDFCVMDVNRQGQTQVRYMRAFVSILILRN